MDFEKFDKIPRLSRDMVITEKIDGTNAQIYICTESEINNSFAGDYQNQEEYTKEFIKKYCIVKTIDPTTENYERYYMFAGSRSRWLDTSSKGDNFGFAKWVEENAQKLFSLGEGRHYGEWYGQGIQRNYGLTEKRFALFNVKRWINKTNLIDGSPQELNENQKYLPNCCQIVPILYEGLFNTEVINKYLKSLTDNGSRIVPNFKNPEGIIIYHTASGKLFKKTILNDEKPKEQANDN